MGCGRLGGVQCIQRVSPSNGAENTLAGHVKKHVKDGCFIPLNLNSSFQIHDVNLYEGDGMDINLNAYWKICATATDLVVTTSCFTVWRQNGRTNGFGKVIPAYPTGKEPTRVFFFDDNMNLKSGGSASSEGICNLRDIATGKYIDFTEGVNGFKRDQAFDQTLLHYSSEYNVVLVQANILDAVAYSDYFTTIISKYSTAGEKIIVFCDVNATIYMEDSSGGNKQAAEILLSTLFALTELHPEGKSDLEWDDMPAVPIGKIINLKQLVRDISRKDKDVYDSFWDRDHCLQFIRHLLALGKVIWSPSGELLTAESFWVMFDKYEALLMGSEAVDGIATSWFSGFASLRRNGDKVILNSFGMDTRRIVAQTVNDEQEVLQLTINYDMWSKMDAKAFKDLFVEKDGRNTARRGTVDLSQMGTDPLIKSNSQTGK